MLIYPDFNLFIVVVSNPCNYNYIGTVIVMAQGFGKKPVNPHKPQKNTAKKEGKRGKGLVKINPKRSNAIISERIKIKLSSQIHKRIEESTIAKARSFDNLQIVTKKK